MDETKKIFQDIEMFQSSNETKPTRVGLYGIQTTDPLYIFDNRAWDKDVIYKKMMALVHNSTEGAKKITKKQYKQIKDLCEHCNVAIVPSPAFVVFRISGKGTDNCFLTSENHFVKTTPYFGYLHKQIKKYPNDMFYIYYAKNGQFRFDKVIDEVPEKLDVRTLRILKLRKLKNKSG